jgi:hypothetical protein
MEAPPSQQQLRHCGGAVDDLDGVPLPPVHRSFSKPPIFPEGGLSSREMDTHMIIELSNM